MNVTIKALGALQGIASPTRSPHSQETANDMTSWQLMITDTTRIAHVTEHSVFSHLGPPELFSVRDQT